MKTPVQKALELLEGAEEKIAAIPALIGLDGFVDSIIRVVEKRHSPDSFEAFETIEELAKRIAKAAGKSANIELVCEKQKLGGNGPIMANAMAAYGMKVRYIGNLGQPSIHPVFSEMARRCEIISVAEPSYTDALEFDDGKLMLTRPAVMGTITWENLKRQIGEEKLRGYFEEARFIALNNWTQIPHMSDVWEDLQSHVAPKLTGPKRTIFFDLADPEKRTLADVKRALTLISGFEKHFNAVLGLNESEAYQIGKAVGVGLRGARVQSSLAGLAAEIRGKLGISTVVIHPREFACAADAAGSASVDGPFASKPVISTGAGDHFNAGFCLGLSLGGELDAALQIGVATSGYYVRTGKSPTAADMRTFLEDL